RSTRENSPKVPVTYEWYPAAADGSTFAGDECRRERGSGRLEAPVYCLGAQTYGQHPALGDRWPLRTGRSHDLPVAERRPALRAGPLPGPEPGGSLGHGATAALQGPMVPAPRPACSGRVRRAPRLRPHGQGFRAQSRVLLGGRSRQPLLAAGGVRLLRLPAVAGLPRVPRAARP